MRVDPVDSVVSRLGGGIVSHYTTDARQMQEVHKLETPLDLLCNMLVFNFQLFQQSKLTSDSG